jgi:hypothetical protein
VSYVKSLTSLTMRNPSQSDLTVSRCFFTIAHEKDLNQYGVQRSDWIIKEIINF